MSSSPGEHLATLIKLRERLFQVAVDVEHIARAVDIEINSFADAALRSGALRYAEEKGDDEEEDVAEAPSER